MKNYLGSILVRGACLRALFLFGVLTLGVASSLQLIGGLSIARADYDPVLEAQEEAKRKAAAAASARQKAENDAKVRALTLESQRNFLGAEGKGLSDAEVGPAYDRKMAKMRADSVANQHEAMAMMAQAQKEEAATRDQRNAAMKQMTGKSANDLMKMSDKELEAFAAEMEKKYGAE